MTEGISMPVVVSSRRLPAVIVISANIKLIDTVTG